MDDLNDNFFQVSVKGLFFNEKNEMAMIQEKEQLWELPGGRIQKGEEFTECLKRECMEETGLVCEILETQPYIVYPAVDKEGRGRIMVFFKIKLPNLNFTPSSECVAMKFFSIGEAEKLPTNPQIKPLFKYI